MIFGLWEEKWLSAEQSRVEQFDQLLQPEKKNKKDHYIYIYNWCLSGFYLSWQVQFSSAVRKTGIWKWEKTMSIVKNRNYFQDVTRIFIPCIDTHWVFYKLVAKKCKDTFKIELLYMMNLQMLIYMCIWLLNEQNTITELVLSTNLISN